MNDMNVKDVKDERDCFAYKNKRCIILKSNRCEGTQCGFYKTKEEFRKGQKKALGRILSLDKVKRDYINETYYGGKIEVI